ncbi:MAG: DUF1553 domain-containing protein [Planctomycetaceae bacterium]
MLSAKFQISAIVCLAGLSFLPRTPAQDIDFNNDVRPILSNNCLACHGPDEEGLKAGLRLDLQETAVRKLESGATAVVPGKPEFSELIARITTDDEDLRMPPSTHGAKLSERDVRTLRLWIEQGAPFAVHWSYAVPQRPAVPDIPENRAAWIRNPIDSFVLRKLQEHQLSPSPEAERSALARRVFLDLTGLPPSVDEVAAFEADPSPDAYEHLVDDLLTRPAFGEHWARKWLDLARYADSAGYADDPPRTIWAYRDWVIRAMNDNMPFDQFTREQLAGDLLLNPSEDQLVATAFHRNTLTNNEGGTQDEEFRSVAIVDRVNTTLAVWMGTTMACAQCHNHKYDPITQDEYFRFYAIFNNTQDADRRDESPLIELYTDEQRRQKAELQQQVTELQQQIQTPTPELAESQRRWEERLHSNPEWHRLRPNSVVRSSGLSAAVSEDGTVRIQQPATTDIYTVSIGAESTAQQDVVNSSAGRTIAAIQLETLPSPNLAGQGAGHGGGNFVITGLKAQIVPPGDAAPQARFVRITNKGDSVILSLAEVQVFSAAANIASTGRATQHSTAFGGPPELAIDGNTDGDFDKRSVTHTDTVKDPWWELDLQKTQSIDRITVWNRTDNGLHTRLKNFTIALLNEKRESVWEQTFSDAPNPSQDVRPSNIRDITFRQAFADYNQQGFEPASVLKGNTGRNDGWAVGGKIQEPHQLILVPQSPVEVLPGEAVRVIIDHKSPHENHVLGQFRISSTDSSIAIERSRIPANLLAIVDQPASERSPEAAGQLEAWYRQEQAPELKSQRQALSKATRQLESMKPATSVPILREIVDNRRETHFQHRGNYLDQGPVVEPGLPHAFTPAESAAAPNRLTVAEWLTGPDNPLTARVLANRYWETIFGRGIVITSEEFGSQGERPTHPELLDWLATELIQSGWDSKALLKLLVMSATYRQSAVVTPEQAASDPDNRWLARGPRVRLSAEMVRDQALFVSGLLSSKMYGPPVNPPQPNLGLTAAFGGSTDWKTSSGEDRYRRAIYTTWRRSNPYPSMATFDAPNREVCTVRRNRTNTPLQSLVTLNDPVYVEAAQSLARLCLQQPGSTADQISWAFRRCLLRTPNEQERQALVQLFQDSQQDLSNQPDEALKLATDPLGALPENLPPADAAAMTVVCNILLNLDEIFLKR